METSGFFRSDSGDRKYKSETVASLMSKIVSNGVFNNELQVIANDNMSVTLKPGFAFINGYFYINDSEKVINIELADNEQSRIDSIVLRYSKEDRKIILDVLEGNYATNPVKPELTRNSNIYELRLCNIAVDKSTDKITTEMIEDCRFNNNDCGNVIFPVEHIDTTNVFSQYEAKFNSWFNEVKTQLAEDVAGNLFNMIMDQSNLLANAIFYKDEKLANIDNESLNPFIPRYEQEIVETENAIAIKFENGIMFCSGKKSFTNVKTSAWGNVQSGGPIIFDDYPVPFTKVYSVTVTPIPGIGNFWVFTDENNPPTLTRPGGWQIARGTANTVNGGLNYTTIGRWK